MSTAKAKRRDYTSHALMGMLAKRYAAPAWALLQQVRNGTGFSRSTTRTADAMAMSLWPSRGLTLHGFEVKVARSDWTRELADPAKADDLIRFCHHWWLVAPKEIVGGGELPATWGLLVPKGDKLHCEVEAPALEPKPVDLLFVASLLRNAAEGMVPKDSIRSQIEEARKAGEERAKGSSDYRARALEQELARTLKVQAQFCAASGIDINKHAWAAGEIGKAVKFIRDGGLEAQREELLQLKARADRVSVSIAEALGTKEAP